MTVITYGTSTKQSARTRWYPVRTFQLRENDVAVGYTAPVNEADTKAAIFSTSGLQKLQAFAAVMARGKATVPAHLSDNRTTGRAMGHESLRGGTENASG